MDIKEMVANLDWASIEKRVLSITGKGFRVCVHLDEGLKWWYICSGIGEQAVFLWDDGTINGTTGYTGLGVDERTQAAKIQALRETPGFWRTKEDAEAYLEEWQNAAAEWEAQKDVVQEPVQEAEGDGLQ